MSEFPTAIGGAPCVMLFISNSRRPRFCLRSTKPLSPKLGSGLPVSMSIETSCFPGVATKIRSISPSVQYSIPLVCIGEKFGGPNL